MKSLKPFSVALTIGGAIGLAISSYKVSKLKREIEETSREIERTKQIIEAEKEAITALANDRVYADENFEKFLDDTEKWIDEMMTEEEES